MPRPRSDIRPRIIQAARERYLEEGVDGASLRAIARDAGTSIGMIYYYFPTKDDLFLGVVEDVYGNLLDDLSVALADDVSVEERIRRLYARVGEMSDVEFVVIRIVIREALVSSSRLERLVERFSRGHLPLVVQTMNDGVREGVLTDRHPLPLLIAAVGSLAIFPQVIRRLLARESPALMAMLPSAGELAPALEDVLLHGIGERDDEPSPGGSGND